MDTDRLLRELSNFLRIPSVSTSPSHNADCRAAAEWVAGELRRLGCREGQFLASDTHPVVWGGGPEVPRAPPPLIYGHYDVPPPQAGGGGGAGGARPPRAAHLGSRRRPPPRAAGRVDHAAVRADRARRQAV